MKTILARLARLARLAAWTCFFCKQPANGNTCANCGV